MNGQEQARENEAERAWEKRPQQAHEKQPERESAWEWGWEQQLWTEREQDEWSQAHSIER